MLRKLWESVQGVVFAIGCFGGLFGSIILFCNLGFWLESIFPRGVGALVLIDRIVETVFAIGMLLSITYGLLAIVPVAVSEILCFILETLLHVARHLRGWSYRWRRLLMPSLRKDSPVGDRPT